MSTAEESLKFEPLDEYSSRRPESTEDRSWPIHSDQWWDQDRIAPGETQPYWELAAGRVDFQLTYARSSETRVFSSDFLNGSNIDDVYDPRGRKTAVGDWSIGDRPNYTRDDTEQYWVDVYVDAAFQEGVHEVCEYLKVDGEMWMNPHDRRFEDELQLEVARFVSRLRALRAGQPLDD